ncbi:MAG TPA: hypothetical protein VHP81_00450 [Lachnospiraceae bacterium]|nr:hypothetical protein [Lachnospiraceae bacterium]
MNQTTVRRIAKDERGSTLLLVVIVMFFIGILGALVLSLTMTNYRMKQVDASSKENFYGSEEIIDEIRAGLEKTSSDCMYIAYNNILLHYVDITNDTDKSLKSEFDQIYIEELVKKLGSSVTVFNPTDSYTYNTDLLVSFLSPEYKSCLDKDGCSKNIRILLDTTNPNGVSSITLEGIKVNYMDSKGYETTITTDISLDSPNLNLEAISSYPEFTRYALIADEQFVARNATGMSVDGNIYAGYKGISVAGDITSTPDPYDAFSYNLKVTGDTLVTRGDITVNDNAALFLGESSSTMDIWAENIATKGNSAGVKPSYLNIHGNCKVADDLTLGAKRSQVVVGGSYFGYSYSKMLSDIGGSIDANRSSAILINGNSSSLDMSGVSSLTVAGSAYISRKTTGITAGSKDILMGESVAVKSNQIAYLVPNEYIWCGHNPVTKSELDGKLAGTDEVDLSSAPNALRNLLTTKGYVKYCYNTESIGGYSCIYYYLEFKDSKSANQYFKEYYTGNKEAINNQIKAFTLAGGSGVTLNAYQILAGNAVYRNSSGEYELSSGVLADPDIPDSGLLNDSIRTAMEYKARQLGLISTSLSARKTDFLLTDKTSNPLFHSIMSCNATRTVMEEEAALYGDSNGFLIYSGSTKVKPVGIDSNGDGTNEYYIYFVYNPDTPFQLDSFNLGGNSYSMDQGIVVASGDITVRKNFEGLILSGGTITMESNSLNVKANAAIVQDIFSNGIRLERTEWKNDMGKKFTHYFAEYLDRSAGATDNISQIDISQYISYENWRKNAD